MKLLGKSTKELNVIINDYSKKYNGDNNLLLETHIRLCGDYLKKDCSYMTPQLSIMLKLNESDTVRGMMITNYILEHDQEEVQDFAALINLSDIFKKLGELKF